MSEEIEYCRFCRKEVTSVFHVCQESNRAAYRQVLENELEDIKKRAAKIDYLLRYHLVDQSK